MTRQFADSFTHSVYGEGLGLSVFSSFLGLINREKEIASPSS